MTLPDFQAQLDAHIATRPVKPCSVADMTPKQYAAWSQDLAAWAIKRDTLRGLVESGGHVVVFGRTEPQCTPKADDYYYRGRLPRKRRAA